MHLLPEKVNSITNLDPGNFVIRNPNALQTFILTVYIDIDYCHFYLFLLFLLYKLRFDSLILNEDDDDVHLLEVHQPYPCEQSRCLQTRLLQQPSDWLQQATRRQTLTSIAEETVEIT